MATQLKKVNYNSDKENYRILLAHFPIYAKSYFRYKFDLILSGHEHGGMISLPHKDKGLIGHKGFFPTFSGGEYFERMKKLNLYTTDREMIKHRVSSLSLLGIFNK